MILRRIATVIVLCSLFFLCERSVFSQGVTPTPVTASVRVYFKGDIVQLTGPFIPTNEIAEVPADQTLGFNIGFSNNTQFLINPKDVSVVIVYQTTHGIQTDVLPVTAASSSSSNTEVNGPTYNATWNPLSDTTGGTIGNWAVLYNGQTVVGGSGKLFFDPFNLPSEYVMVVATYNSMDGNDTASFGATWTAGDATEQINTDYRTIQQMGDPSGGPPWYPTIVFSEPDCNAPALGYPPGVCSIYNFTPSNDPGFASLDDVQAFTKAGELAFRIAVGASHTYTTENPPNPPTTSYCTSYSYIYGGALYDDGIPSHFLAGRAPLSLACPLPDHGGATFPTPQNPGIQNLYSGEVTDLVGSPVNGVYGRVQVWLYKINSISIANIFNGGGSANIIVSADINSTSNTGTLSITAYAFTTGVSPQPLLLDGCSDCMPPTLPYANTGASTQSIAANTGGGGGTFTLAFRSAIYNQPWIWGWF